MTLHRAGSILERVKRGESLPTKHENPYLKEAQEYMDLLWIPSDLSSRWEEVSSRNQKIFVEIGSYMGHNLMQFAESHLEDEFIGLEITYKRAIKCARKIRRAQYSHVRMGVMSDRMFFPQVPDHSLSGVFLFFPDPWPKKKHEKNRIIRPEFFDLLKKKLVAGGFLWFKTDHEPYMENAMLLAGERGWNISEANEQPFGFQEDPYVTQFEKMFLEKKLPIYRRVFLP